MCLFYSCSDSSSWIADPNFCCTFSPFKTPVEQVASRYVKTVLVSGEYIFTGDYCCLESNHKRVQTLHVGP